MSLAAPSTKWEDRQGKISEIRRRETTTKYSEANILCWQEKENHACISSSFEKLIDRNDDDVNSGHS